MEKCKKLNCQIKSLELKVLKIENLISKKWCEKRKLEKYKKLFKNGKNYIVLNFQKITLNNLSDKIKILKREITNLKISNTKQTKKLYEKIDLELQIWRFEEEKLKNN